jgi:hypothetical protein
MKKNKLKEILQVIQSQITNINDILEKQKTSLCESKEDSLDLIWVSTSKFRWICQKPTERMIITNLDGSTIHPEYPPDKYWLQQKLEDSVGNHRWETLSTIPLESVFDIEIQYK